MLHTVTDGVIQGPFGRKIQNVNKSQVQKRVVRFGCIANTKKKHILKEIGSKMKEL